MFEFFTPAGLTAMQLAQVESSRLSHNFVGPEQMLVGLLAEDSGIAASALKSMGVTLTSVQRELDEILGHGSDLTTPPQIPFTPRAKRVLEQTWNEAKQLNHNYISTEHILLGIITENAGNAAVVFSHLEVNLPSLRARILEYIQGSIS